LWGNRDARHGTHRRIDDIEIDYKTSWSICDEVGGRLPETGQVTLNGMIPKGRIEKHKWTPAGA